jgi:hypothetical protein
VTDWLDNDELFERELAAGHHYAELVAKRLRDDGLVVEVTPMAWRSTIEERAAFANEFDLRVGTKRPAVIDVKSRRERFTAPGDFPYETAFVDTVSGWNAKATKPLAIIMVSQITEAMAVIPVSTESTWTTREVYDRTRKIRDRFYEVRRERLRPLSDLVEWLRAREADPRST